MRRTSKFLIPLFVFALSGCTSIRYKPELSLKESPHTINARAKIQTFVDVSPIKDKSKIAFGTSATEPDFLDGNLAEEITNAIMNDFETNRLFISVDHNTENPDVIIKGTIKRFHGTSELNPLGAMTYSYPLMLLWFVGLPSETAKGEIDLELTLFKLDGTQIGIYMAHSEFYKWLTVYNYWHFNERTSLNRAFNEVVEKIREQILADEDKITPPLS
jgi:hypothetical protein